MESRKLDEFTKGWIAGDFEPSLIRSKDFEVGVKRYAAGDREGAHYHKVAREITVVVSGKFVMNGRTLAEGDIIFLERGEPADFACLESGATAVIKVPSVIGDKYPVNQP